jgi:hypothetical protein
MLLCCGNHLTTLLDTLVDDQRGIDAKIKRDECNYNRTNPASGHTP